MDITKLIQKSRDLQNELIAIKAREEDAQKALKTHSEFLKTKYGTSDIEKLKTLSVEYKSKFQALVSSAEEVLSKISEL